MYINTKMEVNPQQITNLSIRLPKLELSYETVFHKKVSALYDVCVSIPIGKRQFAWFTYDEGDDVCYLMDLARDGKIGQISQLNTACNQPLSLGTILYGTLCEIDGLKFFVADDIYYYKGIYIKQRSFGEKMGFLRDVITNHLLPQFSDISSVVFKMACMETLSEKDDIESQAFYETAMNKSAYVSHHLQFRSTTQIMPYLNHTFKARAFTSATAVTEPKIYIPRNDLDFGSNAYKTEAVFRVMADIQSDIYLLYAYNDAAETKFDFVDIAYIGSFKDRVFMNSLFRNIRENLNIDYGEESEDEDMFQNTNVDKYVDLKREYRMVCAFHQKFKKWVPLRTVDAKSRCVNLSQLVRTQGPYQRQRQNQTQGPYQRSEQNHNHNQRPDQTQVQRQVQRPDQTQVQRQVQRPEQTQVQRPEQTQVQRQVQRPEQNHNQRRNQNQRPYQKPEQTQTQGPYQRHNHNQGQRPEQRQVQRPYPTHGQRPEQRPEQTQTQGPYQRPEQTQVQKPKPTFAYNRERRLN
jgi:hypothetical protein